MNTQPRLVEVRQQVLKQNDVVARALRRRFHEAGVCVVSLVSGPGTGLGRDHTIFATEAGRVQFHRGLKGRTFVSVIPPTEAAE